MSVNNQSHLDKDWAKLTGFSTVSLGCNSSLRVKPTFSDNIRIEFNNYWKALQQALYKDNEEQTSSALG